MKKLFLHIGTHKTGTTAIQIFLNENKKHLSNLGLEYPDIGNTETYPYNNHNIAWELSEDKRFHKKYKTLSHLYDFMKNNKKNIILSSEDFQIINFNQNKFQEFKNIIKQNNYSLIIILFLRNQIDYFCGIYQIMLMLGIPFVSPEELSRNLLNNDYIQVDQVHYWFNYHKKIQQIKNVFNISNENIICKSYDENKESLLQNFLNTLDVKIEKVNYDRFDRINIGCSELSIKMVEQLNLISQKNGFSENDKLKIRKIFFSQEFYIGKKFYISNENIKKLIKERFFQSNELVEKDFNIHINKWINYNN